MTRIFYPLADPEFFNSLLKGFIGGRPPSFEPLAVSLGRTWRVASGWVWPPDPWSNLPYTIAAIGLIVAVVAVVAILLVSRQSTPTAQRPVAFALFLPLYLAFIILVKLRVGNMEPRYLTPAVVPLFLLVAYVLDRCLLRCRQPGRGPLAIAMVLGTSVWLLGYSLTYATLDLRFHHANGAHMFACYNSRLWQSSDVVAMLKQQQLKGTLYSNMPRVAYLYSGLERHRIPTQTQFDHPGFGESFQRQIGEDLAGPDPVYLLYIRSPHSSAIEGNPAPPDQLRKYIDLVPRWYAPDGSATLIRITGTRSQH